MPKNVFQKTMETWRRNLFYIRYEHFENKNIFYKVIKYVLLDYSAFTKKTKKT